MTPFTLKAEFFPHVMFFTRNLVKHSRQLVTYTVICGITGLSLKPFIFGQRNYVHDSLKNEVFQPTLGGLNLKSGSGRLKGRQVQKWVATMNWVTTGEWLMS